MTHIGSRSGRIALAGIVAAALGFPRAGGAAVTTADVSIVKTLESADPVHPGDVIVFSITVSNAGLNDAPNVVWSDILPPNTTFDELDSPAGPICTTPLAGGTGTVSCTIASVPANTSVGPFFLQLLPASNAGTITNTATVTTIAFDPNPDNNSSTASGHVVLNQIPTASGWALGGLALAMAAGGILVLRR